MIMESHLATVMSTKADKEKLFGISIQADSLLPGEEYPDLSFPLFPPNFIKIPKEGQTCEVVVLAPDVTAQEIGEPGEDGLGPEEFAEFIFYTGRIFDLKEGQVPAELKTNYPKRTGWWTDEGTIIYMDDTKGSLEIALVLKGSSTFIRIREAGIQIQHGSQKIVLADGKIYTDNTRTELGAEGADQQMILGKNLADGTVTGSLAEFITDWSTAAIAIQTALAALLLSPPVDPTALATTLKAYIDSLVTSLGVVSGGIPSWSSTKHFLDA